MNAKLNVITVLLLVPILAACGAAASTMAPKAAAATQALWEAPAVQPTVRAEQGD